MLSFLHKRPWRDIGLLGLLLFFEMSIHPLGIGPDRRVHDPAVYRLNNPFYLSGDWYTQMAVESGVYTFYAKLIHAGSWLGFSEEGWRQFLYLVSLIVLYDALIRIARLFSESVWVVPMSALLHALLVLLAPPIWLYGPFIQVDGGLAPRSVGIALSFLALYYLLKNARVIPWILLGLATLIHVSNALIVFTLFFLVWFWNERVSRNRAGQEDWFHLFKNASLVVSLYLVAGGWFALHIASLRPPETWNFSTEKFIWTWIYLRAPYMALPLIRWEAWLLFVLHILAIVMGWYWLRNNQEPSKRSLVDLLGVVGIGAVVYFFLFYFFAFVWPWLPGFQFYSLRVIYFAHFVAYLFSALLLLDFYRTWTARNTAHGSVTQRKASIALLLVIACAVFFFLAPGKKFWKRAPKHLSVSWTRLMSSESRDIGLPRSVTARYLASHPEPFLAPPNWHGSSGYVPHVASFKTFGFTQKGMVEWFERLNDVSKGELERIYAQQNQSGRLQAVSLDWRKLYAALTTEDCLLLARKYRFQFFLTYQTFSYPFELIAEDGDYRLYQIPASTD